MGDTTAVSGDGADNPPQRDLSADELEERLEEAVRDAVEGRDESDLDAIRERIRQKRENL